MKFGKFADLTVLELLNINKKNYLRWVYYNCSMITFCDDILDVVNILPEFRIAKPGKDEGLFNELATNTFQEFSPLLKLKIKSHSKKIAKQKLFRAYSADRHELSKRHLQKFNQGKL